MKRSSSQSSSAKKKFKAQLRAALLRKMDSPTTNDNEAKGSGADTAAPLQITPFAPDSEQPSNGRRTSRSRAKSGAHTRGDGPKAVTEATTDPTTVVEQLVVEAKQANNQSLAGQLMSVFVKQVGPSLSLSESLG